MADDLKIHSLKGRVSAEEWQARLDCAALYRLIALHGWDDMVFTHISMRVPGPEHHFLVNPYGMLFDEITASSLVKVNLDGELVSQSPYEINPAGFTIHSAIHAARQDALCVIHIHAGESVAVSAQSEGLLPLTQHALIALPHLCYHDYEGIALNLDERERLVADLGDKSMMLLRNHGALTVGPNAGAAFISMYYLQEACKHQVLALSAGRSGVLIAPQTAQDEVRAQTAKLYKMSKLIWPALLRKLDRSLPGYEA